MDNPSDAASSRVLFEAHPRSFHGNRHVYPVLSRRAGGISIGVNLSLDKACNFDCIYCQVDRTRHGEKGLVHLERLAAELDATVELVTSGRLYEDPKFRHTPPAFRRLNDIAISGDGEPTLHGNFEEAVCLCAEVRGRHGLEDPTRAKPSTQKDLETCAQGPQISRRKTPKLVLITNASLLHRDRVRRGLEILDANGGEIWAKLDAGTEEYYRLVARSAVPFQRILDNLREAARVRPIVIQSLFVRIHGQPPTTTEQEAFCGRLEEIIAHRGRIKLVQLYTIARPPAEPWVAPLTDKEIKVMASLVRQRTGLPVAEFCANASREDSRR